MIFYTETITVESTSPTQMIAITNQVKGICVRSLCTNGLVNIMTQHTTGAIRINEKCDKLSRDIDVFLKELAPPSKNYFHNHETIDGRLNAHSHLLTLLLGSSETLPLQNGQLQLGQWQDIFFVEVDGPRAKREIKVTVMG